LVGQDEKPLVPVPDQHAHLEQRAEEVAKMLEKDGTNDNVLEAGF
jgi:hypothetical protein